MLNPSGHKTITLISEQERIQEAIASGTITPGSLVELISSGCVRVQATAAAVARPAYATENSMIGKTIDDDYLDGKRVILIVAEPGDEILAILAISQTIVVGDQLESAGGGQLRKHAAGAVLAIAKWAVTTTGAAVSRIIVEVM